MALTHRQRIFVEKYLVCWNQMRAAEEAGYKWAQKKGWQLMQAPAVKAAIEERLREMKLTADVVLARLGQQAEINMADFLKFEPGVDGLELAGVNWDVVKEKGYLLKKLSYSTKGKPILELHDSQAALVYMGKHFRLFADQLDVTSKTEQTNVNIYIPDNGRGDNGNQAPA